MISVILTLHKLCDGFEKCIKSIIGQTYDDLEILLVCAADLWDYGAECAKLAEGDKRVKVIRGSENGIISCRKIGLEQAKGDYIAFVNAGDWIEADMYQKCHEAIQRADVDFVETTEIGIDRSEKQYVLLPDVIKNVIESWMEYPAGSPIGESLVTKLYKTDVLRKSYREVPEDMLVGDELITYIALFSHAKTVYVLPHMFYHHAVDKENGVYDTALQNARKQNELLAMCTGMIEKYYPYVDGRRLDIWYAGRGMAAFKKLNFSIEYENPIYRYEDIADLMDKSVVLYGAGDVGRDIYIQLSKYQRCHICGWVDKNYEKYHYPYYQVEPVDSLTQLQCDVVLVAVLREKTANAIKAEWQQRGYPTEKIIWKQPVKLIDSMFSQDVHCNIIKIIGGLGNQMFQYALYRSMQEKKIKSLINIDFFINYRRPFGLKDVFPNTKLLIDTENQYAKYQDALSVHQFYREEADGTYDPRVFEHEDASFYGFWQSEKYFQDIEQLIRREFVFDIKDHSLKDFSETIQAMPGAVSLQVRRGDYLNNPDVYCGNCTIEYYNQAVAYVQSKVENPCFLILSDDKDWVKENLHIENAIYIEADMFDEYSDWYDMFLMTCCKHNIIANSSFGWWGAWLNDNADKIVIAPARWFNNEETSDIWCDGWVKI